MNFCTKEIRDSLSFVMTTDSFILPKKKVVYKIADKEESRELEQFMAEKKKRLLRPKKNVGLKSTEKLLKKRGRKRQKSRPKRLDDSSSSGDVVYRPLTYV